MYTFFCVSCFTFQKPELENQAGIAWCLGVFVHVFRLAVGFRFIFEGGEGNVVWYRVAFSISSCETCYFLAFQISNLCGFLLSVEFASQVTVDDWLHLTSVLFIVQPAASLVLIHDACQYTEFSHATPCL